MTPSWQTNPTTITRLRVRGAALDPLLARLRLASLLDAASLRPAGLAPSSIVCIHSLRDPLPGALQVRGGARPPVAWERAVAASLDALVRRAARPSLGPVPASAEAVLFADRAELLACLALDWLAGQAAARWWWRSLFRGADIAQVVAPLWLDTPEYIPAALAHMAEQGSVALFARRLSDGEAHALLRGITGSFGLPALQAALDSPLEDGAALEQGAEHSLNAPQRDSPPALGGGPFQPQATEMPGPPVERDRQPARSEAPPSAPWRRWAPESDAGALGVDQQCLLGVGLTLQRAPAAARAPSFAPAVARWRGAALAFEQERRHVMPAAVPPHPMIDRIDSRLTVFNSPPRPGAAANTTDPAATATPTAQASGSSAGEPPVAHSAQPGLAVAADDESLLDAWPELAIGSSIGAPPLDAPSAALRPIEAQITTELGGLFYLLNVGLFLNLYGDFTTPAAPGIALPIWDFVTLVGRRLLAGQPSDDPAWALLARLAGRDLDETPGASFVPPDAWRLPPEWLAPFPEAVDWEHIAGDSRLRVRHPEGFLLLDIPLDPEDPMRQLANELASYKAQFAPCALRPAPCAHISPLDRWLDWLLPYVRARLRRALGLDSMDDLAHVVLAHHAHVFVTAAHLDVVLTLAELPIAIRMAGLDRNPGWVPAAGRFVSFHFE